MIVVGSLAGLLVVALVLVVVVGWHPWSPAPSAVATVTLPAVTVSPEPTGTPMSAPDMGSAAAAWYGGSSGGDTRVTEVADGLYQCASRSEGVGGAAVAGYEYQMPRTVEGAVAAGAVAARLRTGTEQWVTSTRQQIEAVFPGWSADTPASAALAAQQARAAGLDPDTGQAIDPTSGEPIPGGEVWSAAYPRYGAYTVLWIAFQGNHEPQQVEMVWLMPTIGGIKVGTDTSAVKVRYDAFVEHMWWDAGLSDWIVSVYDDRTPPAPAVVNPGYDTLAAVTQHQGWCVPADATEAAIPGARMTQ